MARALGIIAFERDRVRVQGISDFRPFSSISFLGRYRLIDFPMSNLSNSGCTTIHIYVKEKPRSVFEHVGTGRHYNMNAKQGKLRVMYGEEPITSNIYNTDVTSYYQNLQYIEEEKSEYVIVTSSQYVFVHNYDEALTAHIESGADVTYLYKNTEEGKTRFLNSNYLTFEKGRRITKTELNRGQAKNRSISLDTYIMKKSLFVKLVNEAQNTSPIYWFSDVLDDNLQSLNCVGLNVRSNVYEISDLTSYYRSNMELIDPDKSGLFNENWPIYTRTNDSPPTRYTKDAKVTNSLIANGAVIEGTVRNSIVGRGAVVGKGAVVENSILLANAYVHDGCTLDHAILDKHVKMVKTKELIGEPEDLVYIRRRDLI